MGDDLVIGPAGDAPLLFWGKLWRFWLPHFLRLVRRDGLRSQVSLLRGTSIVSGSIPSFASWSATDHTSCNLCCVNGCGRKLYEPSFVVDVFIKSLQNCGQIVNHLGSRRGTGKSSRDNQSPERFSKPTPILQDELMKIHRLSGLVGLDLLERPVKNLGQRLIEQLDFIR